MNPKECPVAKQIKNDAYPKVQANCPICSKRPGGSTTYISADYYGHMDLNHLISTNHNKLEKLMRKYYSPDNVYQ